MIANRRSRGDNLTQDFESLAGKIGLLVRQSSGVAARSRQTCDQAAADRIVRQYKDDRDDRRSLPYCWGGVSVRDNDVDLKADKLGRDFGDALGPSLRPAILDRDGVTLDPAERMQSLDKSSSPWTPS
jgi:hypothetical protein